MVNPTSNLQSPTSIAILGIPIHDVTMPETLNLIERFIQDRSPRQICTVNPEFIMAAQKDVEFRQILNHSALNIPDGVGVVWAAKRVGRQLRERVGGSDLVWQIAQRAEQTGWKIFLLGGAQGVAKETAAKLKEQYPAANIVGTFAGSPLIDQEAEIADRVKASSADIVLVAYGAPKQDKWIARNLDRTGATIGIGVGGSFDFIIGKQKRAPKWIQRIGLEWLYRLIREPWRWRRQLALPRFVLKVLMERRRDNEIAG
jgi:N-acetylglucosaminyldiphosphoundecaprenol N-acetyl-beta-D-mannosaminyltransferase